MNKVYNSNSNIYLNYGYLMLPVNLEIAPKIKIGKEIFVSKTGYHVSLLRLRDLSELDQRKILKIAKSYSIKLKKVTNVFKLVKEENRQSVIVKVSLTGLKK